MYNGNFSICVSISIYYVSIGKTHNVQLLYSKTIKCHVLGNVLARLQKE